MSMPPIAILGGGNMARAILVGCLKSGYMTPDQLGVAELDPHKRLQLSETGVHCASDAAGVMRWLTATESPSQLGQILFAVKPQSFGGLCDELAPCLDSRRRVVVSIMAGIGSSHLHSRLTQRAPGSNLAVVRAMPNLPAQIGKGTTAIALGHNAIEGDEAAAITIFSSLGPTVVTIAESMMDAFTAIAGSGPAYLFYVAEAMIQAATKAGFSPSLANSVVAQTLAGSGAMLAESDLSPQALRAAVTSRGGTTEAAIAVLQHDRVLESFVEAIHAATVRSRELGTSNES